MNKRRLRKLAEYIVEYPERYDQGDWLYESVGKNGPPTKEDPLCGTVGCLAGNACLLAGRYKLNMYSGDFVATSEAKSGVVDPWGEGKDVLGLTAPQAYRLFTDWPYKWNKAYHEARSPLKRACVAAEAIKDFIDTNGWKGVE